MYSIPKCPAWGCHGHLGKYDSCRDEALDEMSLFTDVTTGSVEAYGHFVLLHFETDEWYQLGEAFDTPDLGTLLLIDAGWYIVQSTDQGFVRVAQYATEEIAKQAFDLFDDQYGEWLCANEPAHGEPCECVGVTHVR